VQRFREVWWIRHAESLGNAGFRTREHGTYSLTENGFAQAEAFAAWCERRPSLVVTSSFTRARETAAPCLRRHAPPATDEWSVHEITYLAPARCVDTTHEERNEMARGYWERWDPHYRDGDGAETFAEFIDRVASALDRARHCSEPFITVFTHAMFIRGILWFALHRPSHIDRESMRMYHAFSHGFPVPNCAVLPMLISEDGEIWPGKIHTPLSNEISPAHTLEAIRLSGL
jgi:broad specificity phosphatase PhoE